MWGIVMKKAIGVKLLLCTRCLSCLAVVMFLLVVAGCTQAVDEPEPADITPLMWRVTNPSQNDAVLYLFGSMHIGIEDMYPLPTAIMDAFYRSDYLAIEVIGGRRGWDAVTLLQMYMQPEGQTIIDEIGALLYERIAEVLVEEGLGDWLSYGGYWITQGLPNPELREWELMYYRAHMWNKYVLNEALIQRLLEEMEIVEGIDNFFIARANTLPATGFVVRRPNNMQVLEIEEWESREYEFINMSPPLQRQLLEQTIDRLDYVVDETKELFDLWMRGDKQGLREFMYYNIADFPEDLRKEFIDVMYIRRGIVMKEAAERYLAEGRNVFYVVGAAHMVRDGGLVDSLIERGYTVERVVWWD